ncbi:MAG: hypothetical protein ABIP46_12845 [Polaromonas sp.]
MRKVLKMLGFLALALLVLLAALAFAVQRWVATDDFRQRMAGEASVALGVPVLMGAVDIDVWPVPALALKDLTIQSQPELTLGRVEVRPQWQALLERKLVVTTLIVRQAVLPQHGIDAVLLALPKKEQKVPGIRGPGAQNTPETAETPVHLDWLPRRMLLEDVTWVSATGARTALDADVHFGIDNLPDSVSLKLLRGYLMGLHAELKRDASAAAPASPPEPRWAVHVDVGGGRIDGLLRLQLPPKAGQAMVLGGELHTRDVEVSALTAPGKALTGLLEADTTFTARAETSAALAQALQTATTFTVRGATLNGIDLVKAVKTVGLSRGGETHLQTLSGQVTTKGRAAQLANLIANAGNLSASGNVAVSPARELSGHISVNLSGESKLGSAIGGAVGIPLMVSGTLAAPEVTLSRSALVGAALGTVLMPGVGTGAGAKLGEKVSEGLKGLFGK